MSKFLVIAEKPSVAQSYAKNLSAYKKEDGYLEGESCIISWCLGHLAEYAQPEEYDPKYGKWQFDDLPILPQVWKLKVSRDKKKQFDVLKSLMNRADVDYLVNGCDAGREGELIFQRVYDLAGCRKPVKRLWISSMEDTAIRTGFQTMKGAEEYRNICMAAVCRAQADWLIGMNGTRAYTTCYFKRLVVGRVQTPTLAMLAERQDKIEHFQKEAFYKVALTDGRLTVVSENIANEEAADLLASLCMNSEAVITQVKREQKKAFPPKLYDLTSLQREANRYFGYTAKKTLDMLQELYEEKLVTYPRTDSQFVTEDMRDTVEELVGKMPVLLPFLDYGQLGHNITRVINNAKVSDHHAILPTKEAVEKGISDLTADKKNLMMLVCQQLVQATGEEYQYEQTDITVKCQGHDFTARGKVPVQMGFKAAGNAFKNQCVKAKPEEETEKETSIPYGYEEGMTLSPVKAEKTVHFTSPPKPFNEDTLLAAMETAGNKDFDSETEKKGLGTPATRAGIIEKLYRIQVPEGGKTTYNVGTISGGTSVNTIAQEASMLYEFRSDRKVNLAYMEEKFEAAVNEAKAAGLDITYEILGIRPCSGDVDKERQARLLERAKAAVETVTGICPGVGSGSTDCNIPLSMGIPSVCVGCYSGAGAHTREEYVEEASLPLGYRVAFEMIFGGRS